MPVHDGRVAGPGVARCGQKLVPREPSKDGKRRIVHEHRVPPRDAGEKGDERPGDDVPLKVIDQNRAAGDATEGREQAHGLVVGEMVEEQRGGHEVERPRREREVEGVGRKKLDLGGLRRFSVARSRA